MNLARWSLALALVCASAPIVLAQVESRRLSPQREPVPSDSLSAPTLSPDQKRLLYVVGNSSTASLYSVPTDLSSEPTLLALMGAMNRPKISPNSTRALFLGNADPLDTRLHLFEVPIDGSGPALDLTGTFGSVTGFEITPDSTTVVCRADFFTSQRFLLWSLPITGGAVLEESGPLGAGRDVEEFALTPDGARVLYRIDATTDDHYELHSAPIGPVPGSTRLSFAEVGPRFVITSDGARVVYLRANVLFSNPVDGSAPAKQLSNTGLTVGFDFALTSDGARVVYRGFRSTRYQLFSVPTDGSAAALSLTPALPPFAGVLSDPVISPDDTRVAYIADAEVDGRRELYCVPIDASLPPVRVNSDLPPGHVVIDGLAFTHDGTRLAFNAGFERYYGQGPGQLFLAPADGSGPERLLDSAAAWRTDLMLAPGGLRFLYARQMGRTRRLCCVRVDGSTPPLELSSGPAYLDFDPLPSEASVVYFSDDDVTGTREIFARKTNGTAPSVRLSQPLVGNQIKGNVSSFQLAGKRAVYVEEGTPITPAAARLYSVPLAGGTPKRLDAGIEVRSDLAKPALAAGGTRALFLGNHTDSVELFSAPVNGSAPPLALSGSIQVGGRVREFIVTRDGARAIYVADRDGSGLFDVYRVPSDGSGTGVKLSATPDAATNVGALVATRGGGRVLYLAEQIPGFHHELYSANGLGPPVKLSGVTLPTSDAVKPALSEDGAWAFWIADASVDDQFELFRAPANGSASPVRLSGTIVPGGAVLSYVVTPDATRVVFLADREVDGVVEVYTAPADGSAPPQRLTSGGDLQSVANSLLLAPDGTRVVYAYKRARESLRLFSAPVDGSAPQTLLSPAVNFLSPAPYIQISPDSARVVYEVGVPPKLYSSRLDGSGTAIRLEAPIPSSSKLTSFGISPDGQHVVYSVGEFAGLRHVALFDVPIDRRHPPIALTTTFPSRFDGVSAFQFTEDSSQLAYLLDVDGFLDDLFSVPLETVTSPPRTTLRR